MIRRHERSLSGTTPMRQGMSRMLANKMNLTHQAGQGLECPICFIRFYRAPSHAARVGVNYCSVACRCEGSKIVVITNCVICGVLMIRNPSTAERVITCGKKCSSLRRRGEHTKGRSTGIYRIEAAKVAARRKCFQCGQMNANKYVVRNLVVIPQPDGGHLIDSSNAQCQCMRCFGMEKLPQAWAARRLSPNA